jgi:hypothetical protein
MTILGWIALAFGIAACFRSPFIGVGFIGAALIDWLWV